MQNRVVNSFGIGRKALIGPKAGLLRRHSANISKVVRVQHLSEVRAPPVGEWPGEGSAGAACREKVRVV